MTASPNNPYSYEVQQRIAAEHAAAVRSMKAQRLLSTPRFEDDLEQALRRNLAIAEIGNR